jgi:hypothetical protein
MPERDSVVKPLGIVTNPNTVGQYPEGALKTAHNVHMRQPGVVSSLPEPEVYKADAGGTDHTFHKIWASPTRLLAASDTGSTYELRWIDDSTSTAITFPEITFSYAAGKIQMATVRGRHYVTSQQGVLSLASDGASSGYLAGSPAPRMLSLVETLSTYAQAVPDDTGAAWCAMFVRKASDGSYTKIGPPSWAIRYTNTSGGTLDYHIQIGWSAAASANLQAGDIVELYRTPTQPVGVDPGGGFKLAATRALISGDLSAGFVNIVDSTPDAGLGQDLYTNEGQEGALAAKYPPGYAIDAAVYKGHTFYVTQKEAGSIKVRVPGTWGELTTDVDRTHGIGRRVFTADATSGNPTLTNVSNVKGIVTGQTLTGSTYIAAGATVVTVTPTTIVMSANATGSTTGYTGFAATDRLEITGNNVANAHPQNLVAGIPSANAAQVIFDESITADAGHGLEFTVRVPWYTYGLPTLRGTNGQNYDPALPTLSQTATSATNDTRLNRLRISELDQPEAVTVNAGSELLVGSGEIYRIIATTDALWVFASDGLFKVSGEYPAWKVDPIDPTLVLSARNCVDLLRGDVWAFTNRGLVSVTANGVMEVSTGLIGDQLSGRVDWDVSFMFLACDEANREVHLVRLFDSGNPFVWNTLTQAFTTTNYAADDDLFPTALAYAPYLTAMVWGTYQTEPNADIKRAGTSTSSVMAGAEVVYQPITGDGDTFTLKNWIDCSYLFVIGGDGYTATPSFNGAAFPDEAVVDLEFVGSGKDTRGICGVPHELEIDDGQWVGVAMGPDITPGFTVASSGEVQSWKFKGLSLRFKPASETWG